MLDFKKVFDFFIIFWIGTAKAEIECDNYWLNDVPCLAAIWRDEHYKFITLDIVEKFANLQHWKIECSKCQQIDLSKPYESLKSLSMEVPVLKILEKNTFVGLSNLQNLGIWKSQLKYLDENTFFGLTNLQQLYIDGNKLKILPPKVFDSLISLEEIQIWNGKLRQIDTNLFVKNLNLTDISFSTNEIRKVIGSFNNLRNLELWNNSILDISAIQVDHLILDRNLLSKINITLSSVTIAASYNEISELLCEQDGNYSMIDLGLKRNLLKSLKCIEKMAQLMFLDISSNFITSISSADFKNNQKLQRLRIYGNKLFHLDLQEMTKTSGFQFYIDNFIMSEYFGSPMLKNFSFQYSNETCELYKDILAGYSFSLYAKENNFLKEKSCCQTSCSISIKIRIMKKFDEDVLY